MKLIILNILFLFLVTSSSGAKNIIHPATSDTLKKKRIQLLEIKPFEDNLVGYTLDNDDRPFIDFTFSASTPIYLFDYLMKIVPRQYRPDLRLNFAFTARLGQYLGTRYSSPVIEKRFNPYLFFEYRPKSEFKNAYLQIGYGHESNGQSISDSATFYQTAAFAHNNINQAIDYISRGWDYWGGTLITNYFKKNRFPFSIETTVSIKYYMNNGLLEGPKEEYHPWEMNWSGANFTRNDVNGVSAAVTFYTDSAFIRRIQIGYETGITRPLLTNSVKLLVGFDIGNMPLVVFYRYGYNGDLAQYGKINNSMGIAVVFPSLGAPVDKRNIKTN